MKLLYLPHCYSQQRQREKKANIYPVLMAMEATYYAKEGHEVYWEESPKTHDYDEIVLEPKGIPFISLPAPDRMFTRAFDKKYQRNGNFKYTPGTYIMSARGCWHGKCNFCVERLNRYECRPLGSVLEEIRGLKELGFREIFDDSATFPEGEWLRAFCKWAPRGITYGCNMRMVDQDYEMMKQAGFRMVLFGLESANQKTLDKIQKGTRVEDVSYIIKASKAGLDPHVAVMFGYPWEDESDSIRTLRLVHDLLRRGYAKTAQASFYDAGNAANESQRKYVKKIYDVGFDYTFWITKLKELRTVDDIKYFWRQIKKGIMRD